MQLNKCIAHFVLSDLTQRMNRMHVLRCGWASRGVVRLPAVGPIGLLSLQQRLQNRVCGFVMR